MFKKLRNRFLLLNLITISVMMLVAFASIYMITYRDVRNDIQMELHRVMDLSQKENGKEGRFRRDDTSGMMPPGNRGPLDPGPANTLLPDNGNAQAERSVSFTLQTDASRTLISWESKFEFDQTFYESALRKALSMHKGTGQFKLDESTWIFTARPVMGGGQKLVFLDITSRQGILTNLIYTFAVVGSVMLVALFFVSRYFANRSIQPVREAFDKQKQFIADASHELKTPLSIINTNADVLLAAGEDTISSQAKWLHYIKSETERMTRLTNDLLYLTEMEDSRDHPLFAKFDLSEAVETIILTMEAVIFEKELILDYDIEPAITVYGNREQIKQVVMILLDNAIKYTNAKGKITLTLKKQPHEAVLAVHNTGTGIAPEHLGRIFDRFYRTDPSRARKQGGYGLGLAIAKSIVEQHKGKIYAKSIPGESASFFVHLPEK